MKNSPFPAFEITRKRFDNQQSKKVKLLLYSLTLYVHNLFHVLFRNLLVNLDLLKRNLSSSLCKNIASPLRHPDMFTPATSLPPSHVSSSTGNFIEKLYLIHGASDTSLHRKYISTSFIWQLLIEIQHGLKQ